MVADTPHATDRLRMLRRALRRTRLSARLAVLSAVLAAAVVCGTFAALRVQVRTTTRELFADAVARNRVDDLVMRFELDTDVALVRKPLTLTLPTRSSGQQCHRREGGQPVLACIVASDVWQARGQMGGRRLEGDLTSRIVFRPRARE